MTAEIAILNRSAVALAADSAVTVGSKVYTSANKIISLSKHNPVAVMLYGSSSLCGIPWETLIKTYRSIIGDINFNTLEDYANSFFEFVNNETIPFDVENTYAKKTAFNFFQSLFEYFSDIINEIEDSNEKLSQLQKLISSTQEELGSDTWALNRDSSDLDDLVIMFSESFVDLINVIFNQYQLNDFDKETLIAAGCKYLISNQFMFEESTGIVFAGFGDTELFPSLLSYTVGGKYKYLKIALEGRHEIDGVTENSHIVPFAQSDMVIRYLVGFDPNLKDFSREHISGTLKAYNKLVTQMLEEYLVDFEQLEAIDNNLNDYAEQFVHLYNEGINEFQQENYIGPMHEIITYLPLDELAKTS
ncbi:hypothetical protein [Paenibacillus piscarius]|uniref:hypothetical protein n=1 Tax=Paenibacillus piscarius TaxID=1089681 RepID=UPI001EE8730C|nr:hypothetical protein [Paenibacillus piscarius]